MKRIYYFGLAVFLACSGSAMARDLWTAQTANIWSAREPWLVGCNFAPSTAVNELEMWQAETFDSATIDRELGWAQDLGFTSVRVFLHNLLWQQDADGFLRRMDRFLTLAHKHHIGVMFVLLDGVWNPYPHLGKQPEPRPHVHNSGWVQSPGWEILSNPARYDELKPYIRGVVGHFRNDRRVQVWDVFNEPDNPNPGYGEAGEKAAKAALLLAKVFQWAREANPTQPLTSGVWRNDWSDPAKLTATERTQLDNSDVISFHDYGEWPGVQRNVDILRRYGRPILCTEYMARPHGSHFDPILGNLKAEHVGAYSWGFVSGKTQTIYPWDSWDKKYTEAPATWFHDILWPDGHPYDPKEVAYIKRQTGVGR